MLRSVNLRVHDFCRRESGSDALSRSHKAAFGSRAGRRDSWHHGELRFCGQSRLAVGVSRPAGPPDDRSRTAKWSQTTATPCAQGMTPPSARSPTACALRCPRAGCRHRGGSTSHRASSLKEVHASPAQTSELGAGQRYELGTSNGVLESRAPGETPFDGGKRLPAGRSGHRPRRLGPVRRDLRHRRMPAAGRRDRRRRPSASVSLGVVDETLPNFAVGRHTSSPATGYDSRWTSRRRTPAPASAGASAQLGSASVAGQRSRAATIAVT